MYRFYEQEEDGSTGKLIGECHASDDFYFDFFDSLADDKPTIMQSESEWEKGKVFSRYTITREVVK
jgi:hypothetical protein